MPRQDKYERILDALQTLLENKNLQTISVSEIAQEAGIGKGSIYYYFSSKEAILEALPAGGYFTTFAYLQGTWLPTGIKFRRRLEKYFSHVEKSRIVWGNIPPAFAYRCRK